MKINRHGITLSLISFLIAGAPAFAQDDGSWGVSGHSLCIRDQLHGCRCMGEGWKGRDSSWLCIVCACAVFHIRGDVSLRKSEGV